MEEVIVVVDDERGFRSILEILLSRSGYTVRAVSNARAALDLVETLTPSLFILDVMMPDINGIDLCKALRQRASTRQTPIMIFSANDDRYAVQECLDAGADRFVCKSQLRAELLKSVQEMLEVDVRHA